MRKYLAASGIIVIFMLGIVLGWCGGIQHVIRDSDMFITEFDNDMLEIYIELDNNIYEHSCYVG